jgi:hypothetical protein
MRAASPQERALILVEIATVGLPFCVFKIATGLHLIGLSGGAVAGWPLLALGVADVLLNLANAGSVVVRARPRRQICVLHGLLIAGRNAESRWGEVGLALDMMLAFTLVAAMLGLGQLPFLPSPWGALWNLAVVLNVLGAGGLRLTKALQGG